MAHLKKALRSQYIKKFCIPCGARYLQDGRHGHTTAHRRNYNNMKQEKETSGDYSTNYEELFFTNPDTMEGKAASKVYEEMM